MIELTRPENVRAFIAEEKNTAILEDRLRALELELNEVKSQKESLDFGEPLTQESLDEIAGSVVKEVETLVGAAPAYKNNVVLAKFNLRCALIRASITSSINLLLGAGMAYALKDTIVLTSYAGGAVLSFPLFVYWDRAGQLRSYYENKKKLVVVAEKNTVNAVGIVAHEYTHFVQHATTRLIDDKHATSPVSEGHARSVELAVARSFAERHCNPAYLLAPLEHAVGDLKRACSKNLKRLGDHSLGYAAMAIAETLHGRDVYRRVIQSDFSFLQLPDRAAA